MKAKELIRREDVLKLIKKEITKTKEERDYITNKVKMDLKDGNTFFNDDLRKVVKCNAIIDKLEDLKQKLTDGEE